MKGLLAVSADNPGSSNLALWAKSVLMGEDMGGDISAAAKYLNAPERVLKAISAPHLTTDSDLAGLVQTQQILTSFQPLLRNASAFFRALENMIKVPLRQRLTWLTGAASMVVTNEGQAIKVSRMISDNVTIDVVRSSGIVVLSKEFLTFLSSGGERFLSMELRRALVASVDTGFFSLISDGSTPTHASSGSTETAALADVYGLFEAVQLTSESRPLLVLAPDVARRASTLIGGGGRAFPLMGPTSGSMCGVDAMACDGLAAGTMGLLDCSALAGDSLGITIKSARHATIQLESSPDSPATASTTMVNLWQNNLVALQPEVYFGVERLKTNAYATCTGVQWNASGNSPN